MRIQSIAIDGYRPFREFAADFRPLEVLVGANGAGKTSLFEFLRFLRDGMHREIPSEIVAGSSGRQIFHTPGPERFEWRLQIDAGEPVPLLYSGELIRALGQTSISRERLETAAPLSPNYARNFQFMEMNGRAGVVQDYDSKGLKGKHDVQVGRPNQLALSIISDPRQLTMFGLREAIRGWRFYNAFGISHETIRRPVPVEQEPVLYENGGNLSAVLHFLMTEHSPLFEELQAHMRSFVPGFGRLCVKARGARGEVMAFVSEEGLGDELSLADLSDGTLRLLCWATVCLAPNIPTLLCIDEPDQGVHPRTLPLLAGLLQKASDRTQVFLATHSSYFLMQFGMADIAVMRKRGGRVELLKPSDSKVLSSILEDFGNAEIEALHGSGELEHPV